MISTKSLRDLLNKYRDIILRIEELNIVERKDIRREKAVLILRDMSRVCIRRIFRGNELVAYSYYWLDPEGNIIEGWDNAPHHPEIESFPHHRHTKNRRVELLFNYDLESFLILFPVYQK